MRYPFTVKYAWFIAGLLIFVLSIMPNPPRQGISWVQNWQLDKLFHYLSHASIIMLYFIPKMVCQNRHPHNKNLLIGFIVLLMYGVAIELLQKYVVVNRHFDGLDIAANILGDLTGITIIKYIRFRSNN